MAHSGSGMGVKTGIWAALAALFLLSVGVLGWQYSVRGTDSSLTSALKLGTDFALVDHNGDSITQAAFEGRPTMVFFGFTHSPEVCPTTLYEMGAGLRRLANRARTCRHSSSRSIRNATRRRS